jgi:hypothetical protein
MRVPRHPLAHMLYLAPSPHPRAKVTPNGPLKDLHHEAKQVPRQRRIPPPLARLVPDKRMLRLHLKELRGHRQLWMLCKGIFNAQNKRRWRPPTSYGSGLFPRGGHACPVCRRSSAGSLTLPWDSLVTSTRPLTTNSALSGPLSAPALTLSRELSPPLPSVAL